MAAGVDDRAKTRVQPFFEALFARDPSGRGWVSDLLQAAPRGRDCLGELVDEPGWLSVPLAVRGAGGRLACFDYPAAPSPRLLRWFIDHPDRLSWPAGAELSAEAVRLRRALLYDEPPGAQSRAQERARELLRSRSALSREWWRFEEMTTLDCVLITNRLVVTIEAVGSAGAPPATEWYPARSVLVHDLEAARHIAQERAWATLLLSDAPVTGGGAEELERGLPESAPHLDEGERRGLAGAYLGNLTWEVASRAVGIPGPAG
jgi:hypothetical protein